MGFVQAASSGRLHSFAEFVTPVWMRFHKQTGRFSLVRQRITASSLPWLESGGHIWLPLEVPLEAPADRIVESLAAQADKIVRTAYPTD